MSWHHNLERVAEVVDAGDGTSVAENERASRKLALEKLEALGVELKERLTKVATEAEKEQIRQEYAQKYVECVGGLRG